MVRASLHAAIECAAPASARKHGWGRAPGQVDFRMGRATLEALSGRRKLLHELRAGRATQRPVQLELEPVQRTVVDNGDAFRMRRFNLFREWRHVLG